MNDAIMDILAGMRPWYWWLTWFSFLMALGVFFVLSWILSTVMIFILLCVGKIENASSNGSFNWAFALGITAILCAIATGLDKFKKRIFPLVTFAIGQGAQRHRIMDMVRWVVVIGLFVGIVASAVAGVILMPFSHE